MLADSKPAPPISMVQLSMTGKTSDPDKGYPQAPRHSLSDVVPPSQEYRQGVPAPLRQPERSRTQSTGQIATVTSRSDSIHRSSSGATRSTVPPLTSSAESIIAPSMSTQRTRNSDTLSYRTVSQASTVTRPSQSSRSLINRIANRIGASDSDVAEITACGFLKRSTGPLSLAWWSDAFPGSRKQPMRDPGLGWRPFKAVLCGSKIYFYKVPSAMVPEVRATFIVRSAAWPAPIESDDEAEVPGPEPPLLEDSASISESGMSALSPAEQSTNENIMTVTEPEPFFGPWESATRHPHLNVVKSGGVPLSWTARIESGTPAALAHELVFATQAVADATATDETTFLHILFYSLSAAGVSWIQFLHELYSQLMLAERMQLQHTELGCFARAASFIDVILWKRPLLPQGHESEFFSELENVMHHFHQSPEKYAQTLRQLRSWRDVVSAHSAVVMPPDWLSQSHSTARVARLPELEELHTCWSVRMFLARDASEIASQIQVFHAGCLRAFLAVPPTAYRVSSAVTEGILRSFRFDAVRPHWLSHVLLRQLLVDEAPERQFSTPSQSSRAAILHQWIRVAQNLLTFHDLAGWAAIAGVLCSRAVAILEDAWRALPREERTLVAHEWAPHLASLGWNDGGHNIVSPQLTKESADPRTIPFFGNAGIIPAARKVVHKSSSFNVPVAANEPEFLRARALAQQLVALFPQPNAIAQCTEPLFEYQCLFQRLSQFEYPLHTAIVDYVGSAVAATALLDRRPAHGGQPVVNAAVPLDFPPVLPVCTYSSPAPSVLRFPSVAAAAARASRGDTVQIGPDLLLRSAPHARDVPIADITQQYDMQSGTISPDRFVAEVSHASPLRLVDILVCGTQHLVVRTPHVHRPEQYSIVHVGMDMDAFRDAFLYSYTNLLTAGSLLDALRIRWSRAELASREMSFYGRMNMPNQFPSWAANPSETRFGLEPPSREVLSTILLGVICTLYRWLELRPTDWLPDQLLAESLAAFIEEARHDLTMHAWATPDASEALTRLTCALERLPMQRIMSFGSGVLAETPGEEPPSMRTFDWKTQGAAALVEYLEAIAAPTYAQIRATDLAKATGLFESQAAVPGGWLELDQRSHNWPPLDMYEALERLTAERICVRMPQASVADALAPSLRDMLHIHSVFVAWIEAHITEPRIGLERRVQRLSTLVDAVTLIRQRMRGNAKCSTAEIHAAAPPGFVETAIVAALTASASQTYYAAWDTLATRRHADVFAALLVPVDDPTSVPGAPVPCTPDIGWIFTWFATACSQRPSRDDDLLAYTPRLQLAAMANDALAAAAATPIPLAAARSRLRWMHEMTDRAHRDASMALEDAALEGAHVTRNAPHLFTGINNARSSFALRMKQLQGDLKKRSAVCVESASMLPVVTSNEQELVQADESAQLAPTITADEENLQSFSAPQTSHTDQTNQDLLAAVPTQRVSSIFVCTGALLSVWPYQKHPFVFQLTSPSGSKCALKVPNYTEFCEWLTHIQSLPNVRMEASFDPGTYAAKVAECAGQGHAGQVFGISLGELQAMNGTAVPQTIERLLGEIERRGLEEQGIYRVSGTKNAVDALRETLDTTPPESLSLARVDIHVIASVIKLWLRELPEPVVPYAFYRELLDTEHISEADLRIQAMRRVVKRFPRVNFRVLRRFATHLAHVTKSRKKNLMAPHNIGLVFSSTLLNPAPGSTAIAEGFTNLGRAAHVVKIMVVMHRQIFYERGQ